MEQKESIKMEDRASDSLDKIRQQFDTAPYPRVPLDYYPNDLKWLYVHNIVTAYYLRYKRVIETEGKVILDAGCGSGYKTLELAVANPGAKIVGIDISEESIKLARQRLQYHGFEAEFYTLSIENLPELGIKFDYINNDEVLYLLPDPVAGLQAMKSVLKADGVIRTNLHSSLQRVHYYRAQQVFKMMGLMDENPRELEIDLVRDTMKALKDNVSLKVYTWEPESENDEEGLLMNYLFQEDKGYTVPEMFSALRSADLEFVSMVNPTSWDLMELFKEPDNLPVFLGTSLPTLSVEERLHLFELLHPVNRLLDFWCGHLNSASPVVPVDEWTMADWQEALVHIHPGLRTPEIKKEMVTCVSDIILMEIGKYLPFLKDPIFLMDTTVTACVLPLQEGPQPIGALVERWKQVRPVNPATLQPIEENEAFEMVKQILTTLEQIGYVLLERRLGKG
ncbi:methyltransferase domain-containing protein [Argonema galeatum]|uniref:methyltransferase domain-containing protein n=1 Tax=Argonema galeatum TaxID=2942762 RepID=UPI0030843D95|nr:methyltransferase domain-containing protein [Argonema galeatum A003/A1]